MQATAWWQRGIIYEVYPRSFQDTNNDGIGDLAGILARLDYLVELGVDVLWIAPIYPSPMADFGYDISDYCGIDPMFGTLADFDRLLKAAHERGLKLILDFVPNHTSNQHPWFLESRSSRNNPKRDWYLWRDAAEDGGPPNNWLSNFGGSGWEWDATTSQYYYHSFLKQQPDVNWRNPSLREAMFDVLRFWLDRGVDGFRVDVMWLLFKDEQFRNNPINPASHANSPASQRLLPIYNADRPEVHGLVASMRSVLDSYGERLLLGEIYLPINQLVLYYGKDLTGATLPFNFQLIQCPWRADAIAQVIREYEAALPPGAWPNWVLGNHDQARIASRVGRRAGTSGRNVIAHAARNTDDILWRRNWYAECADSRLRRFRIRQRKMSQVSGWDAILSARRCLGTVRYPQDLRKPGPGCPWGKITQRGM